MLLHMLLTHTILKIQCTLLPFLDSLQSDYNALHVEGFKHDTRVKISFPFYTILATQDSSFRIVISIAMPLPVVSQVESQQHIQQVFENGNDTRKTLLLL